MNKKLKIFGVLASVAGFVVSLIASSIDDKKMEAAVDEAVTKKLEAANNNTETVSTEEEPVTSGRYPFGETEEASPEE